MKTQYTALFLIILITQYSIAAEHHIQIQNISFEPEVLDIEIGDTVTWHHSIRRAHSIVATDGSFDTGNAQANEWTYSHTFTQVNPEFFYSSPQVNHMTGVINVVNSQNFTANYGMNGSWYDESTLGQGLSIEMLPESNSIAVYWFTYSSDGDGKQMWLLGVGPMVGNQASFDFAVPNGGRFNAPSAVINEIWGSGVISFSDCEHGSLSYNSADNSISGTIDVVRITEDVVCACGGIRYE